MSFKEGDVVLYTKRDTHMLRKSLSGERGVVRLVDEDSHYPAIYVEFRRDSHFPVSNGWWIEPRQIAKIIP